MKTLTKLMLDIVLTVLFIILIYPRETGLTFHEIAGLSIGALFIFHIILNWSWVKNVTKNLFNPKITIKTRLFYLLNSLSFIAVATIIITGIQISAVLFPAQGMISTTVLVHKWVSYICLVLLGLHLTLHWRFFAHTVPRMFKTAGRPVRSKAALNLGAAVLVLSLLYSQIATNPIGKAGEPIARQESQNTSNVIIENRPRPSNDRLPSVSSSSGSGLSSDESTNISKSSTDNSIANGTGTSSTSSSISSSAGSSSTGTQVSLAQYLGKLFCTGCDKHCSLLSLQCSRGIPQLEAAKQKYQAIYGTAIIK